MYIYIYIYTHVFLSSQSRYGPQPSGARRSTRIWAGLRMQQSATLIARKLPLTPREKQLPKFLPISFSLRVVVRFRAAFTESMDSNF